uniref:Uncharacterized protein n=1 Tax=Ditylenchus dipsaci TaxID=166011 RepID=A0A915CVG7_9BILA
MSTVVRIVKGKQRILDTIDAGWDANRGRLQPANDLNDLNDPICFKRCIFFEGHEKLLSRILCQDKVEEIPEQQQYLEELNQMFYKLLKRQKIISIGVRRNFEFEQAVAKYVESSKCKVRVFDKRRLLPPKDIAFNLIYYKIKIIGEKDGMYLHEDFINNNFTRNFALLKVDVNDEGKHFISSTSLKVHPCQLLVTILAEDIPVSKSLFSI